MAINRRSSYEWPLLRYLVLKYRTTRYPKAFVYSSVRKISLLEGRWDYRLGSKDKTVLQVTDNDHNRIKDFHFNSPMRHENAIAANTPWSSHPKKSVNASLEQWNGCSSWKSMKCETSVELATNDEFIFWFPNLHLPRCYKLIISVKQSSTP